MTAKSWTKLNTIVSALAEKYVSKKDQRQALLDDWATHKSEITRLMVVPAKKKRDPAAPVRPKTSYIQFCMAKRNSVKKDNPELKATEITSTLGELWKKLPEKERKKYAKLAAEDKERYDREMQDYTPPADSPSEETGGRKCRAKKEKDPNAPKKPLSAYIMYSNDQRKVLKEEMPELKGTLVATEIGKRWKALDDEEKAPYLERQAEEKARYEREKGGAAKGKASKPAKDEKATRETKKAAPAEPKKGRGKSKKVVEESEEAPEAEKVVETKGRGRSKKAETKPEKAKKGKKNDGYDAFAEENREAIEEEHNDWNAKKVDAELRKQWKALSADDRESYAFA